MSLMQIIQKLLLQHEVNMIANLKKHTIKISTTNYRNLIMFFTLNNVFNSELL